GATASFNPTTVTGTGSTTMTINTSGNTPAGTYTLTVTGANSATSHTTSVTLTVAAPVSLPLPIRINSGGGSYLDSLGQPRLADTGFQSGSTFSTATAIVGADPALYRDARYSANGPLSYTFSVPNGNYNVKLKFAELYYTSAGQRVF